MPLLDSTGLTVYRIPEYLEQLATAWRAAFGATANVSPGTPEGQIIGIMAERLALIDEAIEAIYTATDPSAAQGTALDRLAALRGMTRMAATKTAVTVTATGTPGTVIPAGSVVRTDDAQASRFVTLAEATIGGGGTVTIDCEAETTGPVYALAGTLTVIVTPVSGWASVTNAADHTTLGAAVEADAALRLRMRTRLLRGVNGLYDAVLAVTGVTDARVFSNDTDATVGDLTPHSIRVVVAGGDDQAVGEAVFAAKAAGIATIGANEIDVDDSAGFTHEVFFDRPAEVELYLSIVLHTDGAEDAIADDAATVVAAEALAWGDAHRIGQDVILEYLRRAITATGITSIDLYVGTGADPTSTANFAVGEDEIAVFDSARITVTVQA